LAREIKLDLWIGVDVIDKFVEKDRVDVLFGSYFVIDKNLVFMISTHSSDHHIDIELVDNFVAIGVIYGDPGRESEKVEVGIHEQFLLAMTETIVDIV